MKLILLLFIVSLPFAANTLAQSKKIDSATQKAIVQQLVSDGELTDDSVREEGGASKVVSIESIDLNRDGKSEFFVYGLHGCACGGRRCFIWVYRKKANGYEMLLSAGTADEISRKKTLIKGYYDLKVIAPAAAGDMAIITYKFNGSRYQ